MIKRIIYLVLFLSAACNTPDKQPETQPPADAPLLLNYAVKHILPSPQVRVGPPGGDNIKMRGEDATHSEFASKPRIHEWLE